MPVAKRKISVSVDQDLVEELEAAEESLSTQVNAALRAQLERRGRRRLLAELLDRLDEEYGPVDETLVEKYATLLA
jgi:antitoxin CcdA